MQNQQFYLTAFLANRHSSMTGVYCWLISNMRRCTNMQGLSINFVVKFKSRRCKKPEVLII